VPEFSSDGVTIAYSDTAAGPATAPAVLLIHGFASNATMNWGLTGWVRDLAAAGFRVIAPDNRGHGASQKLYGLNDYGAPQMADDARRLLDHLNIERAHVVGYSMGARIAAFLATRDSARVKSLIFGGMGANMLRGIAGAGPIAHAFEVPTADDVKNPAARTFRVFAEQTRSDLKALAACIRSARSPITAELLSDIKCPVLVAVATGDVIAGPPEPLAALIPGAQVFEIVGREHLKAVSDKSFKAAAIAFLQDAELKSRSG
jgi:pimeloyl-ACP methyl ester carboxylesterase